MVLRVEQAILVVGLFAACLAMAQNGPPPTPPPPADVGATGVIAPPSEPGERLVVDGQVFGPDGVTPAANVIVYAYQTDATGEYRNDANRMARLHGWVKTDAAGHFEFRTIRPAPYPNRGIPAHIHIHAWGGGYPLQWTPEIKFADDGLLGARDLGDSKALGDFANVRPVTRGADGAWHCDIRFRLSKETNYPPQYRNDPRTR